MARLNFSPKDITAALESKLRVDFRNGKERNGWFILDGKKIIRFTIPHVHSTWGKGTVGDVRRKSRLDQQQFKDLVECPLSLTEFEEIQRKLVDPLASS